MKKIKCFLILASAFLMLDAASAQVTCNEQDVAEIDYIKQSAETSLINADEITLNLETGETLTAFYTEGHLIKMSVTNPDDYLSAELFFRDGFIRHIASDEYRAGVYERTYLYFKDDKLICYGSDAVMDFRDEEKYASAEKVWLERVERYLLAVQ